jgi:hypothetical protein
MGDEAFGVGGGLGAAAEVTGEEGFGGGVEAEAMEGEAEEAGFLGKQEVIHLAVLTAKRSDEGVEFGDGSLGVIAGGDDEEGIAQLADVGDGGMGEQTGSVFLWIAESLLEEVAEGGGAGREGGDQGDQAGGA